MKDVKGCVCLGKDFNQPIIYIMKNLKTLSILAIFGLFASTSAFAQVSSTVTATAEVVTALTVNTSQNIDLGTINSGTASVIKANTNDGAVEANLGIGAQAGQVDVTGATGASVQVDFTNATLNNGSDPLTFTTVVYTGSTAVSSGSTQTLTGGAMQLDLGGSLAAPSGTGTYDTSIGNSGSPITVTITYN